MSPHSMKMRFVLLCILISSFCENSNKCYAEPLAGHRDEAGMESVIDGHRGSTSKNIGQQVNHAADAATTDQNTSERVGDLELQLALQSDELADITLQLSALKDAALGTSSGRRIRHSRSITQATSVPDYFGTLSAYGNCTCRGDPGPVGPPGVQGRDGRDGRDAPISCDRSCPTEPSTSAGRPGNGVYVRWGRTVCPDGSELVYQGAIGGPFFSEAGGGSNQQCLPLEPIYDIVVPGHQSARASIYGTELETREIPTDSEWSNLVNYSPPCAVCLSVQRPTVLMIPARNVCPSSDWTLEYQGQLMASASLGDRHRTEHICVDRHPESIPGTGSDVNGHVLYLVEGRCLEDGGLPCPSYIDGHELTCAVCSM